MRYLVAVIGLLVSVMAHASEYLLRPGDVLRIEVIEDKSLARSALVLPDGNIAFPMIGSLPVAGRTVSQVRADLTAGLSPNFNITPSVFVGVTTLAKPKAVSRVTSPAPRAQSPRAVSLAVFAMGELGKSGKLSVAPGTSLLQFVAQAGGVTPYAATKRVQLRRTDQKTSKETVFRINLRKMMRGGDSKNILLQDGDVIIVPERKLFE